MFYSVKLAKNSVFHGLGNLSISDKVLKYKGVMGFPKHFVRDKCINMRTINIYVFSNVA